MFLFIRLLRVCLFSFVFFVALFCACVLLLFIRWSIYLFIFSVLVSLEVCYLIICVLLILFFCLFLSCLLQMTVEECKREFFLFLLPLSGVYRLGPGADNNV